MRMQDNSQDILVKEEVLDLTAESDEEIVKQEKDSPLKLIPDSNHYARSSSGPKMQVNMSQSVVEGNTETNDLARRRSFRTFHQSLETAIAEIKKGGSLEATALKFGIPQDIIYDRLVARNLPKETEILSSDEELSLVQWILRENKNNAIVMKNHLLEKVGHLKKVTDITPIFSKSKFGKMWYEHFLRRYAEIYENDGILMPSDAHASTSSGNVVTMLSDLEENILVEWIIETNQQNKLVFKHELLEKFRRLTNCKAKLVKSLGRKWYKHFLNKHTEIYENEELLLPTTAASTHPVINKSCQQDSNHIEQFPRGPLKIKKNYAKQLEDLGFKEAQVVLHDFKLYKKHRQRSPKKKVGSFVQNTTKNCKLEDNKQKPIVRLEDNSSFVQETKFDHEEEMTYIKDEKVTIDEEFSFEEKMVCDIKHENVNCDKELDPLAIKEKEKRFYQKNISKNQKNKGKFNKNNAQSNKFILKTEHGWQNNKNEDTFKEADRPMCEKCNKTFCNKFKLIRHLYSHMPKEQYTFECIKCMKLFPSKYHLSVHKKIAHSTKIYHCDECKSVFKHNTSLRKHKRTVHLGREGINVESRSFICDVCQKSFNYKNSLEYHILYGHLEEKKKYSCNVCKRRFIKYSLMSRHKLRHVKIKPFICDHCSKSFSRKYLLREHVNHCSKKTSVLTEKDYKKISMDYLKKLDLD